MLFHSGYNVTSCQKPQPDFPTTANCNLELVRDRNPFPLNCFCLYFVTGMNQVTKSLCFQPRQTEANGPRNSLTASLVKSVNCRFSQRPCLKTKVEGLRIEFRVTVFASKCKVLSLVLSSRRGKKKRQNKTHKRTNNATSQKRKKEKSGQQLRNTPDVNL